MASPTSPSGADVPPVLPSIPLAPETARPADGKSIGALVTDVTTQLSNLVRAEVELAKAEVTAEVRKIRKPERTIESLRESADMLQHLGRSDGPPELDAPSGASAR